MHADKIRDTADAALAHAAHAMSSGRGGMGRASGLTSVALALALAGSLAQAQTTERVSVATGGAQGDGSSADTAMTPDGRFVAFGSNVSTFVAGDTNGVHDVFVRDRQSGTTERVSLATGGAQGNELSNWPVISADGRFVAFGSAASNLVVGDTNSSYDVFVRDRQSGTTERVSVTTGGSQGTPGGALASISADGRFVAFYTISPMVTGDTNMFSDIFVRDRQTGTTERVSVATGGGQANHMSTFSSLSADGRYVAFRSSASNLVAGDTSGFDDIFVRDRQTGTTERVSVSSGGEQGNYTSSELALSPDGRFVAFTSSASNLVAGDTNNSDDVFVHDRQSGTTERVSVSASGTQGNSLSGTPAISVDGRFVAFSSWSVTLVAGDTNGVPDSFVRDRLLGTTERVSVSTAGVQSNADSRYLSISASGQFVAFASAGSTLVADDTNANWDVFVRNRGTPGSLAFCFGDGSGTACPCGSGAAGNGCPSSVNANGANLAGAGSASIASDTFVLSGTGMPNSSALYFQGTSQVNGGLGSVFGDGLRCAGGSIIRLGVKMNSAGGSQYPSRADQPISIRGMNAAGNTRVYQIWYRNAAAFCTPSAFNLSNGLQITWTS